MRANLSRTGLARRRSLMGWWGLGVGAVLRVSTMPFVNLPCPTSSMHFALVTVWIWYASVRIVL